MCTRSTRFLAAGFDRFVYVLVHVDATGTLSIADTRASDVALYDAQLLGTTLFGSGPSGSRLIEFRLVP